MTIYQLQLASHRYSSLDILPLKEKEETKKKENREQFFIAAGISTEAKNFKPWIRVIPSIALEQKENNEDLVKDLAASPPLRRRMPNCW